MSVSYFQPLRTLVGHKVAHLRARDKPPRCCLDKHFAPANSNSFRTRFPWEGALVVATCLSLAAVGSITNVEGQTASPSLDYEFFKTKVQPIFLTKRDGHARCVACHTVNNAPFKLVALSPGAPTWNEEQSRMNFELVKRVAMPGFLES